MRLSLRNNIFFTTSHKDYIDEFCMWNESIKSDRYNSILTHVCRLRF